MSSRVERKREVREQRLAREREALEKARRSRRLRLLGGAGLAALAIVAVLIVVSQSGEDEPGGGLGGGGGVSGAAAAIELFEGIPQSGATLGEADAPVRLVEFVDLQCPFCADYTIDVLPTIVQRYVRSGQIRLELRPLAFIGDDSVRGASATAAAAEQDRAWQFVDVFYRNQGAENSGYVTDEFLRRVARSAGLAAGPVVAAANSGRDSPLLALAEREAARYGRDSTPSFLIARRGEPLEPLAVSALTPEAFTEQLDQAIQGG